MTECTWVVVGQGAPIMAPLEGNAAAEAISAFNNLGYQPAQVSQAVAAAMKELGEEADMAKLIRRGLRELARYKQRHPLIFIDHCDLLTS